MFTQKVTKIVHSVQEIGPFSLFQNLALGKASTDVKCHFAILWPRSFQHQIVAMFTQKFIKIFHSVQEKGLFSLFQNFKPRPIKNVISQSFGLDFVNINVYAMVYQNIPLSSRDKAFFTFSGFGARQSLNR